MNDDPWWRAGSGDNTYVFHYCHEGRMERARKHMKTVTKSKESAAWDEVRKLAELCARGEGRNVAEERLEAAAKLLKNHRVIAADMTNPAPLTQSNLPRLPVDALGAIDEFLLDVTRRLLNDSSTGPPAHLAAPDGTWKRACAYLSARLQLGGKEAPGRSPDLSSAAGDALRQVLKEVAGFAAP